MNPFKRTGFDTMIAKGTTLKGDLTLELGSTTIIDGELYGDKVAVNEPANQGTTTLIVGGQVHLKQDLVVNTVTVTGNLSCDVLVVEGALSIKSGAKVTAREVRYRRLNIESGAVLDAQMKHLDHIATAVPAPTSDPGIGGTALN